MQIARRTATKGLSSDLNLWLLTQYLPGSSSTDQALLYQEYFRLVVSSTNLFELFLFCFPCKSPAKIQLKTRTWHRQSQTITTHNCLPFLTDRTTYPSTDQSVSCPPGAPLAWPCVSCPRAWERDKNFLERLKFAWFMGKSAGCSNWFFNFQFRFTLLF